MRVDVIFPLVMMAWLRRKDLGIEDLLEDVGDGWVFNDVKEYVWWIMKSGIVLGYKGMNSFNGFERVIGEKVIEEH